MYIFIGLMLIGVGIGYTLRHIPALQRTEQSIHYTIFTLLFLFGLSLGGNATLISNLSSFGWQAGILAIAAVSGSVLGAWVVYHLFFKKGSEEV